MKYRAAHSHKCTCYVDDLITGPTDVSSQPSFIKSLPQPTLKSKIILGTRVWKHISSIQKIKLYTLESWLFNQHCAFCQQGRGIIKSKNQSIIEMHLKKDHADKCDSTEALMSAPPPPVLFKSNETEAYQRICPASCTRGAEKQVINLDQLHQDDATLTQPFHHRHVHEYRNPH